VLIINEQEGKRVLARKIKPQKPDFVLLFVAGFILSAGLIMVLSSSSLFSYQNNDSYYHLFYKQLQWAIIGLIFGYIAVLFPYKKWKKLSGIGIIITIILLLLVEYTDLSVTVKGSARWLDIAGFNIQPSEIAKLSLIVFFAYTLTRYQVKRFRDIILPVMVMIPILYLIYEQPDLGTAVVIMITCGVMLLMTELSIGYFLIAIPLIGISGYHLIKNNEYQWNRILGWLNPWEYATSHGYQIVNAEIAFGTGGLFGIGIGRSTESYGYLPESYTDTIFAVIGEEFGFFGTSVVLVCFVILIARGYYISRQCPDRFGRLLGFGITSLLGIQIAVNLCVVTGLTPVTGITLPLVSYGGSSLVITMIQIGILLNISRYRESKV